MKKFILLIFIAGSLSLMAESRVASFYFMDLTWKNTTSYNEKQSTIIEQSNYSLDSLACLNVEVEAGAVNFQLVALNCSVQDFLNIYINNELITNSPENASQTFFDVSTFLNESKIEIKLEAKRKITSNELKNWLKYSQLDFIQGIYIKRLTVKEDAFFGGKLIEVGVQNLSDQDIDGKLYVNIIDSTFASIGENNNCAFSRSNSEIAIEVNFPDLSHDISGNIYSVEVKLVDKENNESVVDELILPLVF